MGEVLSVVALILCLVDSGSIRALIFALVTNGDIDDALLVVALGVHIASIVVVVGSRQVGRPRLPVVGARGAECRLSAQGCKIGLQGGGAGMCKSFAMFLGLRPSHFLVPVVRARYDEVGIMIKVIKELNDQLIVALVNGEANNDPETVIGNTAVHTALVAVGIAAFGIALSIDVLHPVQDCGDARLVGVAFCVETAEDDFVAIHALQLGERV